MKARTLSDIANELGVYYSTVGEYCVKFGFPIRQTTNYSIIENEICEFLTSIGIRFERHNWSILGSKEIDIWLPDYQLGIEVNGLYWHSWNPSSMKLENKNRHIEKSNAAAISNSSLIHITDFEWKNKRAIIESLIKSKVGISRREHARKCRLSEVLLCDQKSF